MFNGVFFSSFPRSFPVSDIINLYEQGDVDCGQRPLIILLRFCAVVISFCLPKVGLASVDNSCACTVALREMAKSNHCPSYALYQTHSSLAIS